MRLAPGFRVVLHTTGGRCKRSVSPGVKNLFVTVADTSVEQLLSRPKSALQEHPAIAGSASLLVTNHLGMQAFAEILDLATVGRFKMPP